MLGVVLAAAVVTQQLDVRVDVEAQRVEGPLEVAFANPTGRPLDAAWFWLYPNRFARRVELDDVTFYRVHPRRFDPGWMRILSPRAELHTQAPAGEGTLARVPLPRAVAPGETARVRLRFAARVPERYGGFGCLEGSCTLAGGFYPMLVALDERGWRFDALPARSRFTGTVTPAATIDLEAPYVALAVTPPLRQVVRRHRGVLLVHRSRAGSPPADDAVRQILPYTEEDVPALVLDAAARALDLAPHLARPGTRLVLVEAPLRLELASGHPGLVLVSDRLFRIFPVKRFRKFHERELVRAIFEALLAERPPDEAEVAAAWLVDLYTVRRFEKQEFASDFLRPVSFVPAVDELLYAPQVAFVEAYFGGPERDALRDSLRRFNHERPGGRLLYEKLRDLLPRAELGALLGEVVRGAPLRRPSLEAFFRQWSRPPAPVDLRLGARRVEALPDGRYRHIVTVERVATGSARPQEQPVEVRATDGDGRDLEGRWDGRGPRGEVAFETRSPRLAVVHVDPRGRVQQEAPPGSPDDPRFGDRQPSRLKFLYNSVGALLNVTDLTAALLVDFELGRVYDTKNRVRMLAFRSEALEIGGTVSYVRRFGRRITPSRPERAASVSLSGGRLDEDFGRAEGAPPRPGNRLSLALGVGAEDRLFFFEPLRGRGWGLLARGTLTDYEDAPPLITVAAFADVTRVVTPWDGHTFVGYLEGGVVWGEIEERAQLLFAGGPGLLRGYSTDSLFTRLRATAHVEYRLALTHALDWNFGHFTWLRAAGLAFFADGGALSPCEGYGMDRRSLLADVGAGIRLFYDDLGVAQGMLGLDFAVPLVVRSRACLDQMPTPADAGPLPFTIVLSFVPPF